MRKREIGRQFDAIVEFAGVERFLDTPVKRYSSGMYVRLAFAVAAHLETEILLVDEVLAVGDQEFQAKCIGKMRDVTAAAQSNRDRSGATTLATVRTSSPSAAFFSSWARYWRKATPTMCSTGTAGQHHQKPGHERDPQQRVGRSGQLSSPAFNWSVAPRSPVDSRSCSISKRGSTRITRPAWPSA